MTGVPDSPYKGLAAFDDSELDALLFFGREREIAAVARMSSRAGSRSSTGRAASARARCSRRRRAAAARAERRAGRRARRLGGGSGGRADRVGARGVRRARATAGLVDTVAAAAQRSGEVHLLLDQFEEYFALPRRRRAAERGAAGAAAPARPARQRPARAARRRARRARRVRRPDPGAVLEPAAARPPRPARPAAPRSSGRSSATASSRRGVHGARTRSSRRCSTRRRPTTGVEAPFLQLVLERLWEREREAGSRELRLETFRAIGGARAVVREHVQGALERLAAAEQDAAARVVRQLVTPSGRKVSHEAADLAEYAHVERRELRAPARAARPRADRARRRRMQGAPTRYEIFHDVLGPPLLAWQAEHQLQRERDRARGGSAGVCWPSSARPRRACSSSPRVAVFALSSGATRGRRRGARTARELAGRALADIPTNPQVSVALALRAAQLAPGRQTADVLRSSLARDARGDGHPARRHHRRGLVRAARRRLLVASSNGRSALYDRERAGGLSAAAAAAADAAAWSPDGRVFVTGYGERRRRGLAARTARPCARSRRARRSPRSPSAERRCSSASGTHVRLVDPANRPRRRRSRFGGGVVAAALDPNGQRLRRRASATARSRPRDPRRAHRPCDQAPARAAGSARSRSARTGTCSPAAATTAPRASGTRAPAGSSTSSRTGPRARESFSPDGTLARDLEPGRRRLRLGRRHRAARAAPRRRDGRDRSGGVQPRRQRDRDRAPATGSRGSTTARTAGCSRRSRATATP